MSKKYYWSRKEESKLRELVEAGITDPKELAEKFDNRTPGAIKKKLERMGVVVVRKSGKRKTTTTETIRLSKDLLTHEQALKFLAGAIEALRKPGQDKLELQRLRILVDALQTYDSVLEKFEGWVEIENRLLEMNKKIEQLQKAQKVSSR